MCTRRGRGCRKRRSPRRGIRWGLHLTARPMSERKHSNLPQGFLGEVRAWASGGGARAEPATLAEPNRFPPCSPASRRGRLLPIAIRWMMYPGDPPPRDHDYCPSQKTRIPSPRRQQPIYQGTPSSCPIHPVRVRPSHPRTSRQAKENKSPPDPDEGICFPEGAPARTSPVHHPLGATEGSSSRGRSQPTPQGPCTAGEILRSAPRFFDRVETRRRLPQENNSALRGIRCHAGCTGATAPISYRCSSRLLR
jgi:hypothetical protein